MTIKYYGISSSETKAKGYRTWHIFKSDIPGTYSYRNGRLSDFAVCSKYTPNCASSFSVKASDSFCETCFRKASEANV